MKRFILTIVALSMLLFTFSCKPTESNSPREEILLDTITRNIDKDFGPELKDNSYYFNIFYEYPTNDSSLLEQTNELIMNSYYEPNLTAEEAVDKYIQSSYNDSKDFVEADYEGGYASEYMLNRYSNDSLKISFPHKNIITIDYFAAGNDGNVHDYTTRIVKNIDRRTGKQIIPSDLFSDETMPKAIELFQERLLEQEDDDSGFDLEIPEEFPANFKITKDFIITCDSENKIASIQRGRIYVKIGLDELAPLFKENVPLDIRK